MVLKNNGVRTGILIAFFLVLFFIFAASYNQSFVEQIDVWVMKNVSAMHQPGLNSFFIFLTNAASRPYQYAVFIFFSVIWLFAERKWREPLVLGVCLFGIRYGNQWFKNIFERERPSFDQVIEITGYSFPSGHAMISIAFFGMLVYLLVQNYALLHSHKKSVYGFLGIFVLLVGFSRVYLGVHYPTDVIGGFLAGGAWLLICVLIYKFLRSNQ